MVALVILMEVVDDLRNKYVSHGNLIYPVGNNSVVLGIVDPA